mmetsp:Transcript_13655/g.39341  ORF Transcript_13655/g.39341 Transcript_13655/m.39341 type:complete len:1266 (+) Transcript_13655:64-3861(+)
MLRGSAGRLMAAKQEAVDFSGDMDRQERIKAMAARIRAEAKAKTTGHRPSAAPEVAKAQDRMPSTRPGRVEVVDPRKEEDASQKLESMLPVMEQKVTAAEDEADKVSILAAPLSMDTSEELRSLQTSAIRDTERAVKAALGAISLARREVDRRMKESESFPTLVKESAKEEIAKLTERLDAAQSKVEEHRNVRRDHEQALAAEKLFGDLASRLGGAELDCEKAAMMAEPLAKVLSTDPENVNAAELREAKEALRLAQATLAPTSRLIAVKVEGLKGSVKKRMQELQERAEASQAILDKAKQTVDEAQSRAATSPILAQALERLEKVEEVLQEMREAEAPFLMGIEVMPAGDTSEVLQKMDRTAAVAQAALADAHKFIALKLVEVGRLAAGAATSARRELEKVQQQVDAGFEKVKAFQDESAKRKRQNLVVIVKEKIEEAEAAVQRLKEAGADLPSLDASTLPEALERALAAELEAQNLVTVARRELQERLQELKSTEGASQDAAQNSDMLRTKVRVSYMEAELGKFRKTARSYEERIKVGRSLTETLNLLKDAEAEVERLAEASEAWPKDERAPEDAEKGIASVQAKLGNATVQVEMKLQTAQGLELKELRTIFARLQRAQGRLDSVKELVRQRNRAASSQILQVANAAMKKAEAAVAEVTGAAAAPDAPAEQLEELSRRAKEALTYIAAAQRELSKGLGEQLVLESKAEFARLQLRCKALDRKGRAASERLAARFEKIASEAEQAALEALRMAARKDDDTYDAVELFNRLSKGGSDISAAQFCEFVTQATPPLSPEQGRAAFKRIALQGLTQKRFSAALADFRRVVRDIVLTDIFEIQSAKRVCRLAPGDLLEAIGATKTDDGLGLQRMRCRLVRDGVCGWVTVGSAGGTAFLERASQPHLWCSQPTALREGTDAASAVVQQLQAGEVLELLQGPIEERMGSDSRVRGVACHEEAVGWLQVRDKGGAVLAELREHVYRCNEAIAMTDVADFANCNMVRRIDAGEALELIPSEKEVSPAEGGARRKFRACRDGREGWITTRGSQGTAYVRPAPKHYICLQAAPMHTGLGAESAVVRVLMPGEAFNAFEEPRDVSGGECITMYRARAVRGGAEGWVTTTTAQEVQPWTSRFVVSQAVPLTSALSTNEAVEPFEVYRMLETGELLDLQQQPVEDLTSGSLRARAVATSDALAGWVTVREASGHLQIRPATAEDEAAAAAARGAAAPTTPTRSGGRSEWQVKEELHEHGGKGAKGRGKGKSKKGKGKW